MNEVLATTLTTINPVVEGLVGWLMWPFVDWPPAVGLVVWSAVFGVIAAILYRYTSPQRRLKRVAEQVRANLLAMRLFKDDLWVTLKTQGRLFAAAGMRLVYSLPPLLVMIIPFALLLAHLGMWYEFRPLRVGDGAVVELHLTTDSFPEWSQAEFRAPAGFEVEARVRDRNSRTVAWRLSAVNPGDHVLRWQVGNYQVTKRLPVSGPDHQMRPTSPIRPGPNPWERLLYPLEPGFDPGAPVQAITISGVPHRETEIFGLALPWWLTFLIVTILAALLAKPLIGVQF